MSSHLHKLTAATKETLKHMIHKCCLGLSDEGERQFDKALMYEEIRADRLTDLMGFMDNYNDLSAHQMMMIRAIKNEDETSNRRELEEMVLDYKLGTMDPGRAAAAFERIGRIKKTNMAKR
jgi:hypothetical protein